MSDAARINEFETVPDPVELSADCEGSGATVEIIDLVPVILQSEGDDD